MSSPELPDLARLRTEYATTGLSDAAAPADPFDLFTQWFKDTRNAELAEPNAMVVTTIGSDDFPASRMVLLKGLEDGSFHFYTNLSSAKGRQLQANPNCALLFPWFPLQRQVRVLGVASLIPRPEVEAYFAQRPQPAQLGAWASHQSEEISSREDLDEQYAAARERFGDGPVPCPDFWGGFAVKPISFEFWHGRLNRLHDRIRYQASDAGWQRQRLQP
jgi:pyridoxamine 5'-phosphate oxidase